MLASVIGPPMVDTFRSLGMAPADVDRAIAAYIERYDATGWQENSVYEGMDVVLGKARASGTDWPSRLRSRSGSQFVSSSISVWPSTSSSSAEQVTTELDGRNPM
ncbi:hypothetical protein GCM10020255_089730 [Rhodococcus baikonurensis]